MILISAFMMVLFTTLTGTIVFSFWKVISLLLERAGKIRIVKLLLIVTICFFLIPVVFLYLACSTGLFSDTKTGDLFNSTPIMMEVIQVAAVFWLYGFFNEIKKYMQGQLKIRYVIAASCPVRLREQKLSDELKRELGIRRKITVYESLGQEIPVIIGLFHCIILIPDKSYREDELKIILQHELLHYRHGDLHLKKLCAWIVRIQWFNPITRLLFDEVDSWGDTMCDLCLCHGDRWRWGIREYFSVVIDNSRKAKHRSGYTGMGLKSSAEELSRRIERMKKYNRQKDFKKRTLVFMVACFTMISSVSSLAAGKGVEAAYDQLYDATKVQEVEETTEASEMEEYTWTPDENTVIVETEDVLDLDARVMKTYDWEIPAGETYETGLFYASIGDTVSISVNTSPKNCRVGVGLHQPSGVMRGVSGTAAYGHTFTVTQNGYHRVYAENLESSTVTVAMTVSR